MRKLPPRALAFVAATWLFGILAIAIAAVRPFPRSTGAWWELGLLVLAGAVAGRVKVRLMRNVSDEDHGSITLGFAFTFTALLRFGPAAAVLVGTGSMLSSSLFPKPLPFYQIAFNTALVALSSYAAGEVFLLCNGGTLDFEPWRSFPAVVASGLTIWGIEAGGVAAAIGLSTHQGIGGLLKEKFLWTAPSYAAAACVTTLAVLVLALPVGAVLLYLSPLLYLTYQSYRLYTSRAEEKSRHVEQMNEREERLRLALSAARMGAWDVNPVTGEMVWHEGAAPLLGLTDGASPGTVEEFVRFAEPADRPCLERGFAKALATGAMTEVQFRVRWPDGSVHWLAAMGQAFGEKPDKPERIRGVILDISERKRAEETVVWQAHHDALTRLPNRVLFQNRLEQVLATAERTGEQVALCFLDLDRFKDINDTLGHAAGDRLLQEVAGRLSRCLRAQDTVARMGGDEFTVILPGLQTRADAVKVAQKLLDGLAQPFAIGAHELHVAASIGISVFPADGKDSAALVSNADAAMYQAKALRRQGSSFQMYSEAMDSTALERLVLENHLREALDRDELILFYQPQVAFSTGRVIGAEALVRWRHPELGLLPPGRFLPLAEETGLIQPLGDWVLRQACRQGSVWQAQGRALAVGVNLSARQLAQPRLADFVEAVLEETGLESRWLNLELTGSALVQNRAGMIDVLRNLKRLGIRISVDGLGTGYPSLASLRHFPVDVLKVDRALVTGLTDDAADQAGVRTMIDLAHALKMEVIAERVETAAQEDRLSILGCDAMQGYRFSPPVPAPELERFLGR